MIKPHVILYVFIGCIIVYIVYICVKRKYIESFYPQCPCNKTGVLAWSSGLPTWWSTVWPSDTTVWLDPWYAGIKNQSGPWGSWNYPWFGGYYMRDQALLLPEYRFVN